MCVCLSELLLGVPPHSGMCVCVCLSELLLGVRPQSDSLSTFIACLAVRLQYSCMYVYSLCVYIDGYDCIVYVLWSILYMCIIMCNIYWRESTAGKPI